MRHFAWVDTGQISMRPGEDVLIPLQEVYQLVPRVVLKRRTDADRSIN